MDIVEYLKGKKRTIDGALEKIIPEETDFPQSLHRAMRYTLFPGGKRIRPILAMTAYEVVGGKGNGILPYACSLELIHTYSLIHDDLPALDNDDYRRGKPTSHKVFGEAMATLAGDALLTEAFHLMSREGLRGEVDPRVAIEVIDEISMAAGFTGMIAGQVVDIESEGKKVELPVLEFIHTHKTGSLILASVRTGGRLGGASDVEMESLTRIKAQNPDVLYISSTPAPTAVIIKNAFELGMYPGVTIGLGHAGMTSALVDIAGADI